jgi:hypothetical protein
MRLAPLGVLLIALVMTALAGRSLPPGVAAQESTPAASPEAGQVEGLTANTLAAGTFDVLSPGTAALALGRIAVAPGAVVPFDPSDPAADLILVTTGELTFRVEAPMSVARKADPGTPDPTEPEAIEAGTEFTLGEGESALFPPATGGEMRNDGDQEATAWVASLAVVSAPPGTPAP